MARTLEEAREKIEEALLQNGSFTHNLVGLILSGVAKEHGYEAANNLVDEFALDDLLGIKKVEKKAA